MDKPLLHETDFYRWTQQQAELIRQKKFGQLDMDNILEELLDMGGSRQRALESCLEILFMHLLKWQYQPEKRQIGHSWQYSIIEHRKRIRKILRKNPSLKNELPETIEDAYDTATTMAAKETGLSEETFPKNCPYTFEQAMNDNFFPEH